MAKGLYDVARQPEFHESRTVIRGRGKRKKILTIRDQPRGLTSQRDNNRNNRRRRNR